MHDGPVPEDLWLLPLGSTPEMGSHKGYGLSAIAQIFGGILSSGSFGPTQGEQMTHFVIAYSIEAFTDLHKFKKSMDDFLQFLAETPPSPNHKRVYYAGLRAHEEAKDRAEKGIPLHEEVVAWFDAITIELGTEPLIR